MTAARALATLAACSYAASCALGIGVATGRLRTGRAHWVHHALYVSTTATAAASATALVAERGRRGAIAVPALLPLALIPFAGTRGWRHPALAAAGTPFTIAALVVAWSPRRRRRARRRKGAR